ncbi:hypothetical protein SBF1_1930011 [Candidatus Desulfosporosinus infrequens]|uniref:Uncharacterized protein n=1 Tax=Candidatus Desulfosporosinus infrequens TaxID=2043169 RepID=A0A2U3KG43_9FIRM|nr:hypothetical protein SBF1_1930011 [Candidatus Desulfosporosinus infrequens]
MIKKLRGAIDIDKSLGHLASFRQVSMFALGAMHRIARMSLNPNMILKI